MKNPDPSQHIEMRVEPLRAQADLKIDIQLSSLAPYQEVTVTANTWDDNGMLWRSTATFQANAQGIVRPATQRPLKGTYQQNDPMGLIWSMYPSNDKQNLTLFVKKDIEPVNIYFKAETADYTSNGIIHTRTFLEQGVRQEPVEEEGLIGTLYAPEAGGPYPGIILLSGSSGVSRDQEAALLATHGYNALALTYFGVSPLPINLQEIPLEYFKRAIDWLRSRSSVQQTQIALLGLSKGAEAALLVAATYPDVNAVIAYAPSAFVHQGLGATAEDSRERSSWTYRGKQLPFIPYRPTAAFQEYITKQRQAGLPVAFRRAYMESLQNQPYLPPATIAVEKIRGPILIISGQDDQMWPSTLFGEMIDEQLSKYQYPYLHQHISYANAGHKIGYPYMPTTINQARGNAYGGTPAGNAYATEHSWQAVLAFLKRIFS
ncbi:acyl-CoA thioester hydrolase/BAAT C-terminal domain-containing protein [Dictyobacter aurantiacus]|uniref:Acyl-CoA thioester hydrolase n=1 Tax=Dictyobacter aurantiacus TaxID=1936993 RepID=A0A401ZQ00_9CHLR|nr:acyl-CoA thioesterase/bile acid-CoA:amino acid N-acyltransferase family protein [Dictyobacter aurantiacus]GCE08890.1 acyl-CoA thioester hydrolase [Dictyobacter aurantiacus]